MLGKSRKPDREVLRQIEEGNEEILVHLFERNYVSAKNMAGTRNLPDSRTEEALRTAVVDLWMQANENLSLLKGKFLDDLILERTGELLESKLEAEEDFMHNSLSADAIEAEKMREAAKYQKYVPDICRRFLFYYYVEKWPLAKIAAKLDFDEGDADEKLSQCRHKYAQLIKRNFRLRNLID